MIKSFNRLVADVAEVLCASNTFQVVLSGVFLVDCLTVRALSTESLVNVVLKLNALVVNEVPPVNSQVSPRNASCPWHHVDKPNRICDNTWGIPSWCILLFPFGA